MMAYDLDTFARTDFFKEIQTMCEKQGLAIGGLEYKHGEPSKYSGSYMVICPSQKYVDDLYRHKEKIEMLIDQKKRYGADRFNPYYYVVDFSDYDKDNRLFSLRGDLARAVQIEAVIINAFREYDYDNMQYPTVMDVSAAVELHDLDLKRHDQTLPHELMTSFYDGHKEYTRYIFNRYTNLQREIETALKVDGQNVSKEYFKANDIPLEYDEISEDFRDFMYQELKDHPQFIFHIPSKPDIVISDVSKLAKKTLKRDHKLFDRQKKQERYSITFPRAQKDIFYRIMLKYNTRNLDGQAQKLSELEEPYTSFVISTHDLSNYDRLAKANGVKYYINHGDLTKEMGAEETRHITIACSAKDNEKNFAICKRISDELTKALPVRHEDVAHNHNKDTVKPKHIYNPALNIGR